MKCDNKIYLVEWHDAYSSSGWRNKEEVEKFIKRERCICINIGWILAETKHEIVMSCRRLTFIKDGEAEWGMMQKIPKSWIRKKILVKSARRK